MEEKRRKRRQNFGELAQVNEVVHKWLEERRPEGCIMNMPGIGTSAVKLRLGEEEAIWSATYTPRAWIETYVAPQLLYVDWKNTYKRGPTPGKQIRGEEPVMKVRWMCEKLVIEIIAVGSPQAKGRVELNHATHQHRLIKKMRRKRIGSHEAANLYKQREYPSKHN
jgi:hypothetical protein